VKTIERAHSFRIPWTPEHIGHHIVRNNHVSHCEQAGIVGSLGPIFCVVAGHVSHDIHVRRLFTGAEMAGIKFHAAIDTEISRNHIYRTCRGLWLDWMAQGTRVTRNLFHDNTIEDLFVEVNHGPFVVDNNVFLSGVNLLDMSEGGAYAHNLFAGKIISRPELGRETPYHPPHSTKVAGLVNIKGGDNRFYNNIFVGAGPAPAAAPAGKSDWRGKESGYGLWVYDKREFPLQTGGNVYLNGARPYGKETSALILPEAFDCKLVEAVGEPQLILTLPPSLSQAATTLVTTELLGKAKIPALPFMNPNGSPLKVDGDYLGKPRSKTTPTAGPFENPGQTPIKLKVW
ncbi:MAG: right-handed parallel beta-helix repeat-containing protein, partial [Verrucomicrobiae bacterium]|nr:right-handed parallel beta-helix repeat-containing protein [Verrucomicrobiae bacterium]